MSREFNIKDNAYQFLPSSQAKPTESDTQAITSIQELEVVSAANTNPQLQNIISPSASQQALKPEADTAAEDANLKQVLELQQDEELVIKNYRLIKKKKFELE